MKFLKVLLISAISLAFISRASSQDYQVKDGLKYKIYKSNPGRKPVLGDVVMVDLLFFGDHDSLIFNSIDKKQIIPIPITASQFKGDLMEGLQLLSIGDSAVFLISGDSIAKIAGPSGASIKKGSWMKYVIKVHNITNEADQAKADESLIKDYIKNNKIDGMKRTPDGLYYKITEDGKGDLPKEGQKVSAHYTGKLLDGTTFDSDKGAGFSFTLGQHQVIAGWDEAFALMHKGTKATLIIPSKLAYGTRGGGPIPANAVLIFDVELVDAQ